MKSIVRSASLVVLLASPSLVGCLGSSDPIFDHDAGSQPALDGGGPIGFDAASGSVDGSPAGDASTSVTLGGDLVLDFGLVDCGGSAPASKSFTVTNTGAKSAHYALGLSTTDVFQIVGASSGDVAPGASATMTIAASAVPASAAAAQVDRATLTITTSDPSHAHVEIPVQRTARGGTLTLAPATVSFGDVPVKATSSAVPVTLSNAGNAPVDVTLGAPTSAAFALTHGGADAGATTIAPGAAMPSLAATFGPSASGAASGAAPIQVAGPVCGASASSIAFAGNGTVGVVGASPGALDFGSVNCGAVGAAKTVTVANTGSASVSWTGTLLGGATSPFTIAPASGSIAPGKSATITVTPRAIPKVASIAADAFGDTLRIDSDAVGDAHHDVALKQTAAGAVLAIDHPLLAFGATSLTAPATLPFAITNAGSLPATITLAASGGPWSVAPAVAAKVSPGTSLAANGGFKPAAVGPQTGAITIATGVGDVICSAPLAAVQLTGTGTNGTMALSTKAIDFASVGCGQKAGPQTFDVSNTGTASFSWSASLGKGGASPYALAPASGTLAAGAKTTVTVTPASIPATSALTANLYGDMITIAPAGISGGASQSIALTETAKGAVVSVSPGAVPFNGAPVGKATSATLTFTNSGTMPVTLTPAISGGDVSSFSLGTPGAHTLAASGGGGASYSPDPTFQPTKTGALASSVTFAAGANDVLCQPLPGAVALTGTGTNGALSLGATSIAIAAQTCGAAAQTRTLTLTNGGNGALTWNAAVLGGSGFKVSPTTGSLAASGGTTTLTLTGPAFPTTHGSVNLVNDTLRVTTNAFGDGPHDVSLASTPSGAILSFVQSSVPFGSVQATKTATSPLTVKNTGNVAAAVTFGLTGSPNGGTEFTFAPQGQQAPGGGQIPGSATFAPTYAGAQSNTVGLTVPGGTALCGALPAAIPVTGTGAQGTFGGVPTGLGTFDLWCNVGGQTQYVSLTNPSGAEPYDFNASVGNGYAVSPATGTVSPNATVTLAVTAAAVGSVATNVSYDTTLAITTDIPGDVAHGVAIHGITEGGVLAFGGAPPPVSTGLRNTPVSTTGVLFNSGTSSVSVDYLVVPSPSNPNSNASFSVSFGGVASTGSDGSALTYTWTANSSTSLYVYYTYDIYVPSYGPYAYVCSAAAHQTVQFTLSPIG